MSTQEPAGTQDQITCLEKMAGFLRQANPADETAKLLSDAAHNLKQAIDQRHRFREALIYYSRHNDRKIAIYARKALGLHVDPPKRLSNKSENSRRMPPR